MKCKIEFQTGGSAAPSDEEINPAKILVFEKTDSTGETTATVQKEPPFLNIIINLQIA